MTHPFKNVRDRLGSVLANIYMPDLDFEENVCPDEKNRDKKPSNRGNPRIADFINEVLPQLEIMSQEQEEEVSLLEHQNIAMKNGSSAMQLDTNEMLRLMKSIPSENVEIPVVGDEVVNLSPEKLASMLIAKNSGTSIEGRIPRNMPLAMAHGVPKSNDVLPPNLNLGPGQDSSTTVDISEEFVKRQVAIRLLQTVSKFLAGIITRAFNGPKPEYYKLLPMLCTNESNDFEPNLARDCAVTLAYLAQVIVPLNVIPSCLDTIEQIVDKSSSWKSKAAVLELLQVIVFSNMPSVLSSDEWPTLVVKIVEKGLMDDSVEVRVKAGQVLSGLLHCAFINKTEQENILKKFYAQVVKNKRTKKKAKRPDIENKATDIANTQNNNKFQSTAKSDDKTMKKMVSRHAGVLGLCAFVNAFPYDVPETVPDILMFLSGYIHEEQPVSMTIKKTLQDFKRTHQDNWQDHKLKFTDDQLAVLTDILVSPSYYA